VLNEIGVGLDNFILVLNKIDAVEDRALVDILRRKYSHAVTISAATGAGLDKLAALVAERLANGFVEVEIETSAGNGRLLAFLAEHATVESREYVDSTVTLSCRIPRQFLHRIPSEGVSIRERNGQSLTAENGWAINRAADEGGLISNSTHPAAN
jgi:GTP-binding protein HflX